MSFQQCGFPFDENGHKWVPWVRRVGPGIVNVRLDSPGGTRQIIAWAPTYEQAAEVGEAYIKEQLHRTYLQGIHLVSGVKRGGGYWYLTYSVEGLD